MVIGGKKMSDIRETAMEIFLDWEGAGIAPATWRGTSGSLKQECYYKLGMKYPEFRYGANHWKLKKFLTGYYPAFIQGQPARLKKWAADSALPQPTRKRQRTAATKATPPTGDDLDAELERLLHGPPQVRYCFNFHGDQCIVG
jgi:hypothetical protein